MTSDATMLDRAVRIKRHCRGAAAAVWPRLVAIMGQGFDGITCSVGVGPDEIDELEKRQTRHES